METGLRVCLLNDSFPPQIDGVANAVVNYARIMEQKHYAGVQVVTPYNPEARDDYPFPVVRYRSLNTTPLVGYRTGLPWDIHAQSRILAEKPTLLHAHCPIVSTYMARILRQAKDMPLIMTYHTKFDMEIRHAIKSKALQEQSIRLLVNNISACDEVWVVSQGAGENLRSLGYEGAYTLMENGVDLPLGAVSKAQTEALRARLAIGEDTPVFLYVGRLQWYKGIKLSLDSLKVLKDRGYDFTMVLVGEGTEKKQIEAYAQAIGLADSCIFTGAIQDREQLRAYYSIGDLFLFPSAFDTNGIVVREAAACGLGALLLKGSCAAEGVKDGVNGLLTEESTESMLPLLERVCLNRGFAKEIGKAAQEQLYCSWEDSVKKAVKRYELVLDNKRKGCYPIKKPRPLEELAGGILQLRRELDTVKQQLHDREDRLIRHIEDRQDKGHRHSP